MAEITVTASSDTDADDGVLTLREALALASDETTNPGADTIVFAPGVTAITLTQGELGLASDVTIDGGTAGVTIDANQASSVLRQFNYTAVTLENLTITGGKNGDIGGGILSTGDLTIIDSTISGNVAGTRGGGIFAVGDLTITNSTISDNVADFSGGGIITSYGAFTLTNSTVTGNSATRSYAGGISLTAFITTATIANSIVAGNTADSAPDIGGVIATSNGHNIFGSDVAGDATGDLENVDPATLFATGLLADNGGPTQTIALRLAQDSPALAGGEDLGLTTDQRGVARPSPAGSDPDIGAFELEVAPITPEIVGTSRKDSLKGTGGDDVIRGRAGDDTLFGLLGDDQLFGDNGRDTLFGKAGIDQLTGGLGADRFVFRTAAEASADGPAYEEILDFSRSQGDRIDLRTIDANDAVGGNQPFKFIGDAALTGRAQLSVQAFDSDFLVSGSTDADGDAEFAFVVRTDLASLRASDFLL